MLSTQSVPSFLITSRRLHSAITASERENRRKMSAACPIPSINLRTSLSSPNSSPSSSSSSTPIRHSLRFASVQPYAVTVRCSQADGPLRRPAVPPLREPSAPTPIKPAPTPPVSPFPPAKVALISSEEKGVVTLEFQRLKAKELQDYFKQKKLEEANLGPFFGFIGKNEIANGRWAMFGFAVGMLTEYATGSSFVDQDYFSVGGIIRPGMVIRVVPGCKNMRIIMGA